MLTPYRERLNKGVYSPKKAKKADKPAEPQAAAEPAKETKTS